jgi:hypothetical protein
MEQWEDTGDLGGTEEYAGVEVVPKGLYLVTVEKNELGMSKGDPEAGKNPKLMADVMFKVLAPAEKVGSPLFEHYVLASNELPTRYDKNLVGSRLWVTMLKKANVPVQTIQSLRMAAETSKGCQLVIDVDVQEETYQGQKRTRNKVNGYYHTSERQPQLRDGSGAKVASAPLVVQQAAPYFAPPMPMPQAMPPQPGYAAPPQPMAPPMPPRPMAAPAPMEPAVPCYQCNPPVNVPVSQYAAHMKQVHGQG